MCNAHIPAVGSIVGSTRLSADFVIFFQIVRECNRCTTRFFYTTHQHIQHFKSGLFADRLANFWCKILDYISILVFDARNIKRLGMDAQVNECAIRTNQLIKGNIADAQTK